MEKDSRLVGVSSISLSLGDDHFRIASDDESVLELLRSSLDRYLVDTDAFLGFRIIAPRSQRGLWVVRSRSGEILGRARSKLDCVAVLMSHLAGYVAVPPGEHAVRFKLRAIVGPTGNARLYGPWAPVVPIERKLASMGEGVVDSPFVDVHHESLRLLPVADAMTDLPRFADVPGHVRLDDVNHRVTAINVDFGPHGATSRALAAARVAGQARSGSRRFRLAVARALAGDA